MHAGGGLRLHQAILEHSIHKGDLGKENICFQSFSRRCDNGTWFAYQSAGCPSAMAPHFIDVLDSSKKRRYTSKGSMHLEFLQCFWILCPRKTLNLIRWSVVWFIMDACWAENVAGISHGICRIFTGYLCWTYEKSQSCLKIEVPIGIEVKRVDCLLHVNESCRLTTWSIMLCSWFVCMCKEYRLSPMKRYSMPFWWATYEQVFFPYQHTKASGYPKFRHQNQHISREFVSRIWSCWGSST